VYCARCFDPDASSPCGNCGADPLLVGEFTLVERLGGGARPVWRAEAGSLTWAIKQVPMVGGLPPKERELLEREAEVLGQLDHPAIPKLHRHFLDGPRGHQSWYLVQDFVDGVTLEAELEGRRYDASEVVEVLAELLEVVVYLHTLSPPVLHRDIKPSNVMRRADGQLALIDFGSVRDQHTDEARLGTVVGTFGYMAPEQLVGDASFASDLYGVAALGVRLLTRRRPEQLLDHHNVLRWSPHAKAPPWLVELLDRALDPDPEGRPASAETFLQALRSGASGPTAAPEGERSSPGPRGGTELPGRPAPRLPSAGAPSAEARPVGLLLAGLVAAIGLGVGLAFVMLQPVQVETEPAASTTPPPAPTAPEGERSSPGPPVPPEPPTALPGSVTAPPLPAAGLSYAEVREILRTGPWEGRAEHDTLRIEFTGDGGELSGTLTTSDAPGEAIEVQVEDGPMGTIVLKYGYRYSGAEVDDALYLTLGGDRRTLTGTRTRRYTSSTSTYTTRAAVTLHSEPESPR